MKTLEALRMRSDLTNDQQAIVAVAAIDYTYKKDPISENCQSCAACCYAFSIPGLKEAGEPCPNLQKKGDIFSCGIYESRPRECRDFSCKAMPTNTPSQNERVSALFAGRELVKERVLVDLTIRR